jgi:tetratricopeptide (TPR) repeat protein
MKIRTRIIIPGFFFLILIAATAAVSAAEGDGGTLMAQGDALMNAEDYTGALAAYEQAIALDTKNASAWNGKADALNRAGNFTAALAASDTAIALDPRSVRGWINRGYILYNLGRYDDELKAYETAISIEPENADAWFNKGYALAGMKRYDEAIAAFDRVKELRPDYPKLEANRRIAEQLRDAAAPWYIRSAPLIAGIAVLVALAAGYFICRKRTVSLEEQAEKDTRQGRRRKERQSP